MRARPTHAARRREALVSSVAAILDMGEPTRFAFEGATVAGLRSGMCLAAWPWREADAQARQVVEDAFKRLGVERPRWIDGQPEFIEPVGELRSCCARCGKPLPEDMPDKGRNRKYCSQECKQNQAAEARRKEGRKLTQAEREAAAAATRAARLARPCAECGRPINRMEREAKYCSRACAGQDIGRRVKGIPKPRG
jgi:endogenous inhibitor of DNA gyrase (YacG/DUF329 family)